MQKFKRKATRHKKEEGSVEPHEDGGFQPSKKSMCTCMPKYSLNTYVGRCQHGCIYCYRYLPEGQRKSIVAKVRRHTANFGLTFGSREGFSEWNTSACDGASYLQS